MAIPTDLMQEFDPKIRQRGHEYFISGDVQIREARDGIIRARVHGSQHYNVVVDFSEGWLDYDCDCPYAESWGAPCKHVWAVMLKADADGLLQFDGEMPEDDNGNAGPIVMDFSASRRQPEPPAPPAWKKALAQIRR